MATSTTSSFPPALRIGFIGAGNMGATILRGMLGPGGVAASAVMASDARAKRRDQLAEELGIAMTESNLEVAAFADLLVVAVKPQSYQRVLSEVQEKIGPQTLVVSIAAGLSLEQLEAMVPEGTRVVRTMPNTPAQVGAGATAITGGTHASAEDLAMVHAVFDPLGITEEFDESLLDAITGLSGSGPAYIFVVIEAMADAGVKMGLHRASAQRFAAQTVLGAAKLLIETGEHPGRLKDMVASPGGTTISGLHTLEAGGLRRTLIDAVENATLRSRELRELLGE